jgi:serine/threonine protein kinase
MPDTLSDDERTMVTVRAEQFKHALIKDGVTDWEPFLRDMHGAARLSLLVGLIVLDLGFKWGKGEKPKVEEYIARFPELNSDNNLLAAIIIEEYRCRHKAGERTDAEQYRERFPALYPTIKNDLDAIGASWTIADRGPRQWEPIAEGLVEVSQQYELVRELGRGQFGEVWLARKKPSGIEKAIKILLQAADRESAQRELKSLELIKNLRHPYLLATEDFWIANNRLHVVMELADGTLRGRLKQHQAEGLPGVPLDELFRYISEAAEGLDYLHGQHITHRDVKPDNILLLHGHAKVADFGLARLQMQHIESMSLAGTPAYMAPEVWGGEGGPASDLYSLAFVYAELRQGRGPLKPRLFTQMLQANPEADFQFNDAISEPERAVLRKAMATQPHLRHRNCMEFVTELAAAVSIPFAGGTIHTGGSRPTPALSAIFGGGTERDESNAGHDTANTHGTIVEEPKPKPEPKPEPKRPSRAQIIAEIFGIASIPIVLGAIVWFLFFSNKPLPPTLTHPTGTTPENGTNETHLISKKVPEWVFAEKNGVKVRFRLIAPQSGPAVEPFYISETKITNKLYSDGDETPVVNITAMQARDFAQSAFGGDLPSAEEWDHAAGFFDQQGQATPTLSPGRAWIDKPAPGPVKRTTTEADVNRYGLLDMAGNGREWTRTVLAQSGTQRDLSAAPLADTDKLILRGRNFTLDRPLSFAMLEKERTTQPQAATPTVGSPYTSFRVVLKLP